MITSNHFLKCSILILSITLINACKKPAGPGGHATVKGKVYAYDYDNTQNYLISKGYSPGEKVYIVYGNNTSIGNNVTTSIDGTFEFKYLTKGKYKVFCNSLDTAFKVKGNDTEYPVIMEFEIKDAKQKITLEDIVINK
jgi:hypothetical protein